jgi:tRNA threonylcarbamoyladenosine biosynthesis protein TsaE
MDREFTLFLKDEHATLEAGSNFSKTLHPGLTLYLNGNLGAGKTTFVRGVLRGLGFEGKVKSPTYTLVEPYQVSLQSAQLNVYHFDLYRFNDPDEWEAAGFRDYFNAQSICLIEWPERAKGHLPEPDIEISLSLEGEGRQLKITALSSLGVTCLNAL